MKTAGQLAEEKAADYLRQKQYRILDMNWRTRWCEIDIIAQKGQIVYFVEVKYRRESAQGTGVDYITPRKLQQMHFAVELWQQAHEWPGDVRLSVIEVSGRDYAVTNHLDIT